jgi:hypothetical protein
LLVEPPASGAGGLPLPHPAARTMRAVLAKRLAAFRFMDSGLATSP